MFQQYLFDKDNKTGKMMFDPLRFEVVWFDVKQTQQLMAASAYFMVAYVVILVLLVGGIVKTFGLVSPFMLFLAIVLFSTRDYLGVALAVVYYGLLKMKLPAPPTPPPSIMALLLALSLFALIALPASAQGPYIPPDDVASPAEIGAQMTAILQWSAIKWFLGFSFAVAGLGLLLVTIKQSVR